MLAVAEREDAFLGAHFLVAAGAAKATPNSRQRLLEPASCVRVQRRRDRTVDPADAVLIGVDEARRPTRAGRGRRSRGTSGRVDVQEQEGRLAGIERLHRRVQHHSESLPIENSITALPRPPPPRARRGCFPLRPVEMGGAHDAGARDGGAARQLRRHDHIPRRRSPPPAAGALQLPPAAAGAARSRWRRSLRVHGLCRMRSRDHRHPRRSSIEQRVELMHLRFVNAAETRSRARPMRRAHQSPRRRRAASRPAARPASSRRRARFLRRKTLMPWLATQRSTASHCG